MHRHPFWGRHIVIFTLYTVDILYLVYLNSCATENISSLKTIIEHYSFMHRNLNKLSSHKISTVYEVNRNQHIHKKKKLLVSQPYS